jgi:hypothetical protein
MALERPSRRELWRDRLIWLGLIAFILFVLVGTPAFGV